MFRKSQIQIFIILGLVILFAFGVVWYSNEKEQNIAQVLSPDSEQLVVERFIETCVKNVANAGLSLQGLQGGLYKTNDERTFGQAIPYYFYLGENTGVGKERIVSELSLFITTNLNSCIDDFSELTENGFSIAAEKPRVDAVIRESDILIELDYPLEVNKGDTRHTFHKFSVSVPSQLHAMHSLAQELMHEQQFDPDLVLLDTIADLGIKYGFRFDIMYSGNSVVYSILNEPPIYEEFLTNHPGMLPQEPKIFTFAIKYDWGFAEQEIELFSIEPKTAIVGAEFVYTVQPMEDSVTFSDLTPLFNITQDGTIRFVPSQRQIGQQFIPIIAVDKQGNRNFKVLELNIIK